MSRTVRGWLLAAVSVAACGGAWTAVYHADKGLRQMAGREVPYTVKGVCHSARQHAPERYACEQLPDRLLY